MADLSKTWYGNNAQRGNLTFQIGESLQATKRYNDGIEGYDVKVTRYLWCSMSTGGVAVSGSVCNGWTSVSSGNNGTTVIVNSWFPAGSSVSVSSCSASIKMNGITATSSLSAQTYTLPEPSYAVIQQASGQPVRLDEENNNLYLSWVGNGIGETYKTTFRHGSNILWTSTKAYQDTGVVELTVPYSNSSLAQLVPNANSITLTAELETIGKGVSTKEFTLYLIEDSGFRPTLRGTASVVSSHAANVYESFRGFYMGYSRAQITPWTMAGQLGATLGHASLSFANNSSLDTDITASQYASGFSVGPFNKSGVETVTITVFDTRGFSVSNELSFTIQSYQPINITGFYVDRCLESGVDDTTGTYIHPHGTIAGRDGTTIGYVINCVANDGSGKTFHTEGNLAVTSSTRLNNVSALIIGNGEIDPDLDYDFVFTLRDGVGPAFAQGYIVQGSYTIMDVTSDKRGIAFLGESAESGKFKVGGRMYATGGMYDQPCSAGDLNEIVWSGKYFCENSSNRPVNESGWLESFTHGDNQLQIYYTMNGSIYRRIRMSGQWGAWFGGMGNAKLLWSNATGLGAGQSATVEHLDMYNVFMIKTNDGVTMLIGMRCLEENGARSNIVRFVGGFDNGSESRVYKANTSMTSNQFKLDGACSFHRLASSGISGVGLRITALYGLI